MSVYNKPGLKDINSNSTPQISHKKNNSMNYSMNEVKFLQGNANNNLYKQNLVTNPYLNLNTESNINSKPMSANSNINKLLTSTNLKNRRIEIDLDKDISSPKFNNSARDNIILLKNKQSTSQNNINNKNKNNNFNNINININISKKIISTYYNKSKNKKNIVVKKNSINSINNSNSNLKKPENIKYSKIINKENIYKNPSEVILRKYSNKNSNLKSSNYSNQNKNKINYNSLYFSTNNNITDINNKNNTKSKSNIYKNNHINYNSNDINTNTNNYFNNGKKYNGSVINNKIKDNKSTYLSQIQIPMNVSFSPKNINSIQNYFKYLGSGQNNNYKNNIYNKNKKLSNNSTNTYIHNNTEVNLYNNTYINENINTVNENLYDIKNIMDFNKNDNPNISSNNYLPNKNRIKKNQRNQSQSFNKFNNDNDEFSFETPEELHYFFVNLFQKGKVLNFDNNI